MKKLLQSELFNNLKQKSKNYGFWMSLISAIVIFLQALGIKISTEVANEVIGSICSILVVLGIISNPTSGHGYIDKVNKENLVVNSNIKKANFNEIANNSEVKAGEINSENSEVKTEEIQPKSATIIDNKTE